MGIKENVTTKYMRQKHVFADMLNYFIYGGGQVIGPDSLEELDTRDSCAKVRRCVRQCLDKREAMIITLRYGLSGEHPLTQREIAEKCGISRSYVSRRA